MPSALKGKDLKLKNELAAASAVSVEQRCDSEGLKSVIIKIAGPLAQIPSSSNSRMIVQRKVWSHKKRKEVLLPMSIKKPEYQARLEALRELYLCSCDGPRPMFGRVQVHMQALLCDSRADGNNANKAICDFLQEVRLVDDDDRVQAWPCEKGDYDCADCESTQIVVVRFKDQKARCREFIEETIREAMAGTQCSAGSSNPAR